MRFADIKTIKEYILSKITEELIFSYYLDIPVSDIIDSINNASSKVRNKHRFEQNPSVKFVNNGKLRMKDFGSRQWCGDCFHIAGLVLRRDCNDSRDFMYILNHIIENLVNKDIKYITIDVPLTINKGFTKIDVLVKDFNKCDYNYFNQYHIRNESLINIFPVENYWIDNVINKYQYSKSDPCYTYYLGNTNNDILWKLYFPYRKPKDVRFITNNKICIENINEIKGNRILILTKSQKDKILLRQIFKDLNITIVDVYSTLSETIHIPEDILRYLRSKYNNIYSLFDTDSAGIDATNYLLATHNIYPYLLVGQYSKLAKDPSDTSKQYGYNHILNIIKERYINIINGL